MSLIDFLRDLRPLSGTLVTLETGVETIGSSTSSPFRGGENVKSQESRARSFSIMESSSLYRSSGQVSSSIDSNSGNSGILNLKLSSKVSLLLAPIGESNDKHSESVGLGFVLSIDTGVKVDESLPLPEDLLLVCDFTRGLSSKLHISGANIFFAEHGTILDSFGEVG